MTTEPRAEPAWVAAQRGSSGLGVCCAEAQADGVPCPDPSCRCGLCAPAARAYAQRSPAGPEGSPAR